MDGALYKLQVLDFPINFAFIHRKQPALTTTTNFVYKLFWVNLQQEKSPGRSQRSNQGPDETCPGM
jgi:hypothetical protein